MEIAACIFIIVFGTLGHFIFEWSGHKHWAGLLFAVNESTWEHIKLTIYPSFIWMAVEAAVLGFSRSLVAAQACSMCVTMLLIPGLFYGYTAFTGQNWLICDIICFCVSVIAGRICFSHVMCCAHISDLLLAASSVFLVLVLLCYLVFSFHPLHNFLFRDPISGDYGPHGHGCHTHYHKI